MSWLRKINIALGISVCFFIAKPYFYSTDYIKPLLKECSLKYTLKNNVLSFEADNDEEIYEWLYELYPHVESFFVEENKKCIKGAFLLKKRLRF